MILRIWRVFQYDFPFNTWYGWRKKVLKLMTKTASSFVKYLSTFTQKSYFKISFRDCVRNLDLRVQVHPGELLVSKSVGAHSTRSLKISGCKRWCPKDLQVSCTLCTHANAFPDILHMMHTKTKNSIIYCSNDIFQKITENLKK